MSRIWSLFAYIPIHIQMHLAQFSLNNVHKRGLKHHHFIYIQMHCLDCYPNEDEEGRYVYRLEIWQALKLDFTNSVKIKFAHITSILTHLESKCFIHLESLIFSHLALFFHI